MNGLLNSRKYGIIVPIGSARFCRFVLHEQVPAVVVTGRSTSF
jgi:hypothetical protein